MDNNAKIPSNTVDPLIWVEKYRDSLFNFALSRLRDTELAEESIQETFLAALQARKDFKGLASEKTWLISILKRKICDHFRRINRDRQFSLNYPLECLSYDVLDRKKLPSASSNIWLFNPSMVYEQKEFLVIVMNALSKLPDRLALVFILREVIDMNSQDVCEFMDISICNFYVMIHRARKRLRYFLQLKWIF